MSELPGAPEALPQCIYIKSEPLEDDEAAAEGRRASGHFETAECAVKVEVEDNPLGLTVKLECPAQNSVTVTNNKSECKLKNDEKRFLRDESNLTSSLIKKYKDTVKTTTENKKKKKSNFKRNNFSCLSFESRKVKCPVCLKMISCSSKLKEHMTVHTGVKPFECHCGKRFRLKSILKDHLETHIVGGVKKARNRKKRDKKEIAEDGEGYICNECGKLFKRLYLLKQHFRTHSDDRPFICDTCDKCFKTKGHLIDHMDSHTTGQPFMCSKCGNTFKRASCLKCHIRNGHCSADRYVGRRPRPNGPPKKRKPRKPKHSTVKPTVVKAFPCTLCTTSYSNIKNLYTHIRYVHKGLKMHKCQYCDKDFRDKYLKVQHERVHTGERPFACKSCGGTFNTSSYLNKHSRACGGRRAPRFMIEDKTVMGSDGWTKPGHVEVEITKLEPEEAASSSLEAPLEKVTCKYSDSEAEDSGPVTQADTATGSTDHLPELSPDAFPSPSIDPVIEIKPESPEISELSASNILIKHVDISKPFACDQCGKSFSKISVLNNHILTHSDKLYPCEECGKTFNQIRNLNSHMRVHSNVKDYKCEHCGKCFTTKVELRSHSRTHTGERPYACPTCGKTFGYRASLNYHKRTHYEGDRSNSEKFKCSECDKAYSHKKTLEMHKIKHTGKRPYVCKECGKSFVWPNNLKTHSKSHATEKPYVCVKCGKSFARKDTLRFHMATHSDERPLVCDQCGKSFFRASSLATHIKTHVAVRPYGCEQCGKRFALPNGLKKHIESHLKIKKRKARTGDVLSLASF